MLRPFASPGHRPQLAIATGTVYCHKFYALNNIREVANDRYVCARLRPPPKTGRAADTRLACGQRRWRRLGAAA